MNLTWPSWKVSTVDDWKVDLINNAIALHHKEQSSPKRAKELRKGERHGRKLSQKNRSRVKDTAIPAVPSEKGDGEKGCCTQWTFKGSCSRGATCASERQNQIRGKGKGDTRQRTSSPPNRRQPSPEPDVSNKTGTSTSGRKTIIAITGTLRSAYFKKEFKAEQE